MFPALATHARLISRLTAFADKSDEAPEAPEEFIVPEDLSVLSGEELEALHQQAVSYFDTVYAQVNEPTFATEDMDALSALTDGIEKLQVALDEKAEERAALAEKAAALAVRVKGEPTDELADDSEDEAAAQAEADALEEEKKKKKEGG